MKECSVKRGEIISRQTKSTKLSGFQFTKISFEFYIDQNRFLPDLSKPFVTIFNYMIFDGS